MPARRIAFVLAATGHGSMILSRLDGWSHDGGSYGVGWETLEGGSYAAGEVQQVLRLLDARRARFGDGVVALDCGANIGVHTLEWARRMAGWGQVIAVEAQERVFYALAGNIALNNCFNARAVHAALGAQAGTIRIPVPDYLQPGSLGSLELRASERNEFIGQAVDRSDAALVPVPAITVDGLGLTRLDLMKVDVEGMEAEVLDGARMALDRWRPVVMVEHIKTGPGPLLERLAPLGYTVYQAGMNLIAVHPDGV